MNFYQHIVINDDHIYLLEPDDNTKEAIDKWVYPYKRFDPKDRIYKIVAANDNVEDILYSLLTHIKHFQ